MKDDFLKQEGIEVGYFAKRKAQFVSEIEKGIKSTGVKSKVSIRKKTQRTNSKATGTEGKANDFYARMKAAKEAKAKERAKDEKNT